jgi:DNA-binding MarR family transcriptional regulator
MGAPDEIIHQSMRLRLAAALSALRGEQMMEFNELKACLEATEGNLGSHIATMEKAGYLKVEKDFAGKRPRTRVALTKEGRKALRSHVAYLRGLLDGTD